MNNFNLLQMLPNLMQLFSGGSQPVQNQQNFNADFSQNPSNNSTNIAQSNNPVQTQNFATQSPPSATDYPDVFYTKPMQTSQNNNTYLNNQNSSATANSASFYNGNSNTQNFNMLKNLLPLIAKSKGKNMGGITELLNNVNPQISQIMSLFSGKKKQEQPTPQNDQPSQLNLSEYKQAD